MVLLPAGNFYMGAFFLEPGGFSVETLQHLVTVSQAFWIGKFEITQAQWLAVMGENPSYFQGDAYGDTTSHPVEQISWDEAQGFCTQLSALTGDVYRLPTEAEWEYACRAGSSTRYFWGNDYDPVLISEQAWFLGNSGETTHPVGLFPPNARGLYDTSGNVWEWTADWLSNYSVAAVTDPTGPETGTYRIQRGGSFYNEDYFLRSALRSYGVPEAGGWSNGLRVVREP